MKSITFRPFEPYKNEEEESQQKLITDHGYAWLVVFASFIVNYISCGLGRDAGIFFLLFREEFSKDAQTTASLQAFLAATQFFTTPLATAFTNRFSERASVILGTILGTIGFALSGFALNFYILFFSYSILQGLTRSLTMTPALTIVNKYFKYRRGLALAIALSGCGIGGAVLLPFLQWLADTYGYMGAFLILAAVNLNLLVCAFLFRTFSFHVKLVKLDWKVSNIMKATNQVSAKQYDHIESKATTQNDYNGVATLRRARINFKEKNAPERSKRDTDDERMLSREEVLKLEKLQIFNCKEPPYERGEGGKYVWCCKHLTEFLSICFPVDTYTDKREKSQIFHFGIFKNEAFIFVCLSNLLSQPATANVFGFLPVLANEKDFTDAEVAFIQACYQVFDTVGKIVCGFVLDLPSLMRFQSCSYIFFHVIACASVTLIPVTTGLHSFSFFSAIAGFFAGALHNLRVLILADLFGDDILASSYGAMLFFQGFSFMAAAPMSGALKDRFGSFDYAFYFCGGCLALAALFGQVGITMAHQRNKVREEGSNRKMKKLSWFKCYRFEEALWRWREHKHKRERRRISLISEDCIPLVEKRFVQP